ncbi:MAG: T9SS type A sorting domain-containing protein [Bacteroidales bacterium]|nr:T9SS type A sorting domain-containing protein [Bacteroidales bacterium]
MRNKALFSLLFALLCCVGVRAQRPTLGDASGRPSYSYMTVHADETSEPLTISITNWRDCGIDTVIAAGGYNFRWQLVGSLSFSPNGTGSKSKPITSMADTAVTVYTSNSDPFAKGVIRLVYGGYYDGCASWSSRSVYKCFPSDGRAIAGDGALTSNDTVVFSVTPVLTANINANIGFDLYHWEYPDSIIEPVYTSGDSSAYTFRVNTQPKGLDNYLKVWLGRCAYEQERSTNFLSLPLRAKAPVPNVVGASSEGVICASVENDSIRLRIADPQPGVEYVWSIDDVNVEDVIDTVFLMKYNQSVQEVFVTAKFNNDNADNTRTQRTFYVIPPIRNDVQLFVSDECSARLGGTVSLSAPYVGSIDKKEFFRSYTNYGDLNTITLRGNLADYKIPLSYGDTTNYNPVVTFELNECASVDTGQFHISKTLHLRPSAVSVKVLDSDGQESLCFEEGDTLTLKAVVQGNVPQLPGAVYSWGNHTFVGDAGQQTVQVVVRPGDTQFRVTVSNPDLPCAKVTGSKTIDIAMPRPVISTSIDCIDVNVASTITLSVEAQTGNPDYRWTLDPGLASDGMPSIDEKNTLQIPTNGTPGVYHYSVRHKSVSGGCIAESVEDSVVIGASLSQYAVMSMVNGSTVYFYVWDNLNNSYVTDAKLQFTSVSDPEHPSNSSNGVLQVGTQRMEMSPFPHLVDEQGVLKAVFAPDGVCNGAVLAKSISGSTVTDTTIVLTQAELAALMAAGNKSLSARRGADDKGSALSIAPNPVSDLLTINLPSDSESVVTLYTLGGRCEKSITVARGSRMAIVDVSGLSDGIYIVHVRQDGAILSGRVQVKH